MDSQFSSSGSTEDEDFEKRRCEEIKLRREQKKCSQPKCRLLKELPKIISEALSDCNFDLRIQLEAFFVLEEIGKDFLSSNVKTC